MGKRVDGSADTAIMTGGLEEEDDALQTPSADTFAGDGTLANHTRLRLCLSMRLVHFG